MRRYAPRCGFSLAMHRGHRLACCKVEAPPAPPESDEAPDEAPPESDEAPDEWAADPAGYLLARYFGGER